MKTIDRIAALAGPAPQPRYTDDGKFDGYLTSPPDSHVPQGNSAWSWRADQRCYPHKPCIACDPPIDRAVLRAVLTGAN